MMGELTKAQMRRFLRRAQTLEAKAVDLFLDIEEAAGEDAALTSFASGAMTSCVELVTHLGGRDG